MEASEKEPMLNLNKRFENRFIGATIIGSLVVLMIVLIVISVITIRQINSGKHVKIISLEWNIPENNAKIVYKHDTLKLPYNQIIQSSNRPPIHPPNSATPATKSNYNVDNVSQSAVGDHAVNNNWMDGVKPRAVDSSELNETLRKMGMDKKANKPPNNNIKLYSSTTPETIRFMRLIKTTLIKKGYDVKIESGSFGPQQMPGNFWIVQGSSENAIFILDAKVTD